MEVASASKAERRKVENTNKKEKHNRYVIV
jgi:hypothetical protein